MSEYRVIVNSTVVFRTFSLSAAVRRAERYGTEHVRISKKSK